MVSCRQNGDGGKGFSAFLLIRHGRSVNETMQIQKQQMKIVIPKNEILPYVLFVLATTVYTVPMYLTTRSTAVYYFCNYLPAFIMGCYLLQNLKKPTYREAAVIVYGLALLVSTVMNDGSLIRILTQMVRILLPCMVLESLSADEKKMKILFYAMRDITMLFFLLNIFLTFVYPNGISGFSHTVSDSLYGNTNVTIRAIYPGFFASCMLDINRRRPSLWTILFFAGVFYLSLTVYVMATAVVGTTIILCWLLFEKVLRRNLKKALIAVLVVIAVFEIGVIVSKNEYSVLKFMLDFFQKDENMTGRYLIWEDAIALIRRKFLWGYGLLTGEELLKMVGNSSGTHNLWLDMLLEGGVFGLVTMGAILLCPVFHLLGVKNVDGKTYILMGFCIALLIMSLTEPFRGYEPMYIPMFCLLDIMARRKKPSCIEEAHDDDDT